MDAEIKKLFFDAAVESPGGWLLMAIELKSAADRLDWVEKPITEKEVALSLIKPYRLLIALSIENLIKGILVADGLPVLVRGKFSRDLDDHDLARLASKLHCKDISVSPEELALLTDQKKYIEWAGRYPLPKSSGNYEAVSHGTREHHAELALWKKLYDHLYRVAWVMKGGPSESGGYRLYFDRPTNPDVAS